MPTIREDADWTFITVTYNSAETLRECWGSFAGAESTWIVVDNSSTDDSVATAERLGARVVALPRNVGFSAANNVGLRISDTEYVAFVNPDVEIDEQTLHPLTEIVKTSRALVAPQLVNPDGTVQASARGLPFLVDKFAHRGVSMPGANIDAYLPRITRPTYIAWSMGAALTGRREDFIRLGGWDEGFFLYYEDHDIGLRAWQAGLRVIATPDVRWAHHWARETMRFNFGPWRRELASAARFYRRYPELLLPTRRLAARKHRLFSELEGRPAA